MNPGDETGASFLEKVASIVEKLFNIFDQNAHMFSTDFFM